MHQNRQFFYSIILEASSRLNIRPEFVEKDYYVTSLLKEIAKNPEAMFKGGTSLVKGWRIEDRFSEDIDINLVPEIESTDSHRMKLCSCCENAILSLGLKWTDDIRHRREFNRFTVPYNSFFSRNNILRDGLMIEEVAHKHTKVKNTTYTVLPISNYIWDAFAHTEWCDKLYALGLSPFNIPVQNMDVTFVEKCLSLSNKYLEGNSFRVGRHLYDIYCMINRGNLLQFDLNYAIRATKVCLAESKRDICLRQNMSFKTIFVRSLLSDFYKDDYNNNLMNMKIKQDNVTYEMCKRDILNLVSRLEEF